MNFSLTALTISSQNRSPLFSFGTKSSNTILNFHKINANRFFSNFINGNSVNSAAKFTKSRFTSFLSSAICIDNHEFTLKSIVKRIHFEKSEESLLIKSCNFENCTDDVRGGAIVFAFSKEGSAIINCHFTNCKAPTFGAIILQAIKSSVISRCCFTHCSAISKNSVLQAAPHYQNQLNMSALSRNGAVDNLAYIEEKYEDMLTLKGGAIAVQYNNFTKNRVNSGTVAISICQPFSSYCSFLTIARNDGGYAIERSTLSNNEEFLSHVNILHHQNKKGTMHLQIYAVMSRFVFMNVTINPLIYAETNSLTIFEMSSFDCPMDQIKVKAAKEKQKMYIQGKLCNFSHLYAETITFNHSAIRQCFPQDNEVIGNSFGFVVSFLTLNPHIFGLIIIVLFIIALVVANSISHIQSNDEIFTNNDLEDLKLEKFSEN